MPVGKVGGATGEIARRPENGQIAAKRPPVRRHQLDRGAQFREGVDSLGNQGGDVSIDPGMTEIGLNAMRLPVRSPSRSRE